MCFHHFLQSLFGGFCFNAPIHGIFRSVLGPLGLRAKALSGGEGTLREVGLYGARTGNHLGVDPGLEGEGGLPGVFCFFWGGLGKVALKKTNLRVCFGFGCGTCFFAGCWMDVGRYFEALGQPAGELE